MLTIKNYILQELQHNSREEVAITLGITSSMISKYLTKDYSPTISIAIKAYFNSGVILHPYGIDSIKLEAKKINFKAITMATTENMNTVEVKVIRANNAIDIIHPNLDKIKPVKAHEVLASFTKSVTNIFYTLYKEAQDIKVLALNLTNHYAKMIKALNEDNYPLVRQNAGLQLVIINQLAILSNSSLVELEYEVTSYAKNDVIKLMGFYIGEIQDNLIKDRSIIEYLANYANIILSLTDKFKIDYNHFLYDTEYTFSLTEFVTSKKIFQTSESLEKLMYHLRKQANVAFKIDVEDEYVPNNCDSLRCSMKDFSLFNLRIDKWAFDRFNTKQNITTQLLKLGSEYSEMMLNVTRGRTDILPDDIGDQLVVLTSICRLSDLNISILNVASITNNDEKIKPVDRITSAIGKLHYAAITDGINAKLVADYILGLEEMAKSINVKIFDCWEQAWNDIKDRKGKVNAAGNFIKDSDTSKREI